MKGYTIQKIYVVHCDRCNEEIGRSLSGEEPTTQAEAEKEIRDHERIFHSEAAQATSIESPRPACGCCEVNDYDPAPEGTDDVPGSCLNCGHSPEEHE